LEPRYIVQLRDPDLLQTLFDQRDAQVVVVDDVQLPIQAEHRRKHVALQHLLTLLFFELLPLGGLDLDLGVPHGKLCRPQLRQFGALQSHVASIWNHGFLDSAVAPSNVEAEMHDIAFAHDVLLALEAQPSRLARASFTAVVDVILKSYDFGANE